MMRRRSLLRIDNSKSGRRRVALQQRASISARAGGPSIDLFDITQELTGSPTLCGSTVTMMQPADLWNRNDLALRRSALIWSLSASVQQTVRDRRHHRLLRGSGVSDAESDRRDNAKRDKQRQYHKLREQKWQFGLRRSQRIQGRYFLKGLHDPDEDVQIEG